MQINIADPGAWHLNPQDASKEYTREMCAEVIDAKGKWKELRSDNHAFDIAYNLLFLHDMLGIANLRDAAPEPPKKSEPVAQGSNQIVGRRAHGSLVRQF